jgi:hypothetical protein
MERKQLKEFMTVRFTQITPFHGTPIPPGRSIWHTSISGFRIESVFAIFFQPYFESSR